MNCLGDGVHEMRHDALFVGKSVQRRLQSNLNSLDRRRSADKVMRSGSGQGQGDEAHASRGGAAQSISPQMAMIALAVQHETVRHLIVEEVLQSESVQAFQVRSVCRRE